MISPEKKALEFQRAMFDFYHGLTNGKIVPKKDHDKLMEVMEDMFGMRKRWKDSESVFDIEQSGIIGKRQPQMEEKHSPDIRTRAGSRKTFQSDNLCSIAAHVLNTERKASVPQSKKGRPLSVPPKKSNRREDAANQPPDPTKWKNTPQSYLSPLKPLDKSSVCNNTHQYLFNIALAEANEKESPQCRGYYYTNYLFPVTDLEFKILWNKLTPTFDVIPYPVKPTELRETRMTTISSTMFCRMKKINDPTTITKKFMENDHENDTTAANYIMQMLQALQATEVSHKEEEAGLSHLRKELDSERFQIIENLLVWRRSGHSSKPDGIGYDKSQRRLFPIEVKATAGYSTVLPEIKGITEEEKAATQDAFNKAKENLHENIDNEPKRAQHQAYQALNQTYHAMYTLDSSIGFAVIISGPFGQRQFRTIKLIRPSNMYNDHLFLAQCNAFRSLVKPMGELLCNSGFKALSKHLSGTAASHQRSKEYFSDGLFFEGPIGKTMNRYQKARLLDLVQRKGELLEQQRTATFNAHRHGKAITTAFCRGPLAKLTKEIAEFLVECQISLGLPKAEENRNSKRGATNSCKPTLNSASNATPKTSKFSPKGKSSTSIGPLSRPNKRD